MTETARLKETFFKKLAENRGNNTLLEDIEIAYLGRDGIINKELSKIVSLPRGEKKERGQELNALKTYIQKEIELAKKKYAKTRELDESIDVTLPGKKRPKGSLHLVNSAIEEITRIFESLGFIRVSYPEVEWEQFAFSHLNMPENHPARDDFETFFIEGDEHPTYGKMVLTPHTSSGQVREMMRIKKMNPHEKNPPIRMINIGKCYRRNWDITHTPMFHQFEGLCVDRSINITHLKGTIEYFVHEFFGKNRMVRFRPFHFQFTEPSFELDISCNLCEGRGILHGVACRVCKSGWLELGGAGMVHPFVLKSGGYDPDEVSGWAFGFGIERNFMMKEGLKLPDMKILYSGDVRFLEQF
ncbi:MAG TPA: phenylalanine--tRNA ligase subunit alpha [Patescibacteria group bacterium]|nr:phenylalanine--tRNA ligase subunit alpha [Patescibacteria group bacterium]